MKNKREPAKAAYVPAPGNAGKESHADATRLAPCRSHTLNRIRKLPRDVGWMLLAGGLMSEVVMGLPPFWVLGILILFPQIGAPLAGFLERKAPHALAGSLDFVDRYLEDLERRYPRRPP